jgi:uncharacterized protein involved in exopolysaccharide biosynthesis
MKRILKFLAYLYPSSWRTRYGAEYETLIDDATPRLQDTFNVLWTALKMQLTSRSLVRIVLPSATCGAFIAAAVSFTVPPRYVSQFTFIAEELRGPTTRGAREVTEDESKHALSNLRDILFDRNFLASTIQKFDLYALDRTHIPLDKVTDKMQKNIEVKRAPVTQPGVPGNRSGFIVDFVYPDPRLAQRVGQWLAFQTFKETIRKAKSAPGGLSQPYEGFVFMEMPSLPQKPVGWSPLKKTTLGLFAGLFVGLIIASILGSRDDTTAVSG